MSHRATRDYCDGPSCKVVLSSACSGQLVEQKVIQNCFEPLKKSFYPSIIMIRSSLFLVLLLFHVVVLTSFSTTTYYLDQIFGAPKSWLAFSCVMIWTLYRLFEVIHNSHIDFLLLQRNYSISILKNKLISHCYYISLKNNPYLFLPIILSGYFRDE